MDLELPKNYIFIGKTGSGKTQCFKAIYSNILLKKYPKQITFVLCPTADMSHDFDFVQGGHVFTNPEVFVEKLSLIFELAKNIKDKGKDIQINVIIDDGLGVIDFNSAKVANMIVCSRHYNVSFFIMIQQLTKYVQGTIRNNFSYIFVNRVSDNSNLKCLFELTSSWDSLKECKKYVYKNCANYQTIFINNNSIENMEPLIINSRDLYPKEADVTSAPKHGSGKSPLDRTDQKLVTVIVDV